MRRGLWIVAIGCVTGVLVLGAAGYAPDGPDPGATTPDPRTPDPGTYPPGVDATGVQNASALLAAHHRSLLESGYVVATEYTYRTSESARNFTYERRIAATPGLDRVLVHRSRRDRTVGRSVIELWANETTAVGRFDEAGDRPTVRPVRRVDDVSRRTGTDGVARLLADGEFDLVAVTTGDGRTLYTLRGTGYESPTGSTANASFAAQVVVTGTGRIRSASATLTRVDVEDGHRRTTLEVFTYHVTRTGVETIRPPDWVDEAGTDGRPEGSA